MNIPLTNCEGRLHRNAADIWLAFKYFPDDEACRRQAVLIASDERERFLATAGEDWQPSALSKTVMNWAGKKNGQITVAGYTALAFILLLEQGHQNPSLYAAAKVVSTALNKLKPVDPVPLKTFHFEGDWELRDQSSPTSIEDIMKAFRRYSSIAHLEAADIATSEHFLLMHIFNRTPETMLASIRTAFSIETVLSQRVQKDFHDYWSVAANLTPNVVLVEPIYIEGSVRAFLESGLGRRD